MAAPASAPPPVSRSRAPAHGRAGWPVPRKAPGASPEAPVGVMSPERAPPHTLTPLVPGLPAPGSPPACGPLLLAMASRPPGPVAVRYPVPAPNTLLLRRLPYRPADRCEGPRAPWLRLGPRRRAPAPRHAAPARRAFPPARAASCRRAARAHRAMWIRRAPSFPPALLARPLAAPSSTRPHGAAKPIPLPCPSPARSACGSPGRRSGFLGNRDPCPLCRRGRCPLPSGRARPDRACPGLPAEPVDGWGRPPV